MARVLLTLLTCSILLLAGQTIAPANNITTFAKKGAHEENRVISLAPSNTELIYAIHAQDSLVGVSTYCTYPPQAKMLEKVGTFNSVNFERLARLKPNTILLVSGQELLASRLRHKGFTVQVLDNSHLSSIANNIRILGNKTGHAIEAEQIAKTFEEALEKLKSLIDGARSKPRVFYCVWLSPLLTVGGSGFLNDVITTCGGTNIASDLKPAYPHFSLERLVVSQPEVIILPWQPSGYSILSKQPWKSLRAVSTKRTYFLPEADNLSRPTLTILKGLHWLSYQLHPELAPQLFDWLNRTELAMQKLK